MKTKKTKLITILFLLCLGLPIFAQEYVYISVEKADLKEGTGFFASKVAQVEYGTKLLVLENSIEDKWIKVTEEYNQSVYGWILSSNVTKKRVINYFNNNSNSSKEIALAGKGFSEGDISLEVKNFDAVDVIEKNTLSNEELKQFITEGKLNVE